MVCFWIPHLCEISLIVIKNIEGHRHDLAVEGRAGADVLRIRDLDDRDDGIAEQLELVLSRVKLCEHDCDVGSEVVTVHVDLEAVVFVNITQVADAMGNPIGHELEELRVQVKRCTCERQRWWGSPSLSCSTSSSAAWWCSSSWPHSRGCQGGWGSCQGSHSRGCMSSAPSRATFLGFWGLARVHPVNQAAISWPCAQWSEVTSAMLWLLTLQACWWGGRPGWQQPWRQHGTRDTHMTSHAQWKDTRIRGTCPQGGPRQPNSPDSKLAVPPKTP